MGPVRRMIPRFSFQFRVFLSFLIIIFCFLPAVGFFGFIQWHKSLEQQIEYHSLNTVFQIAEQVSTYLAKHSESTIMIKETFERGLVDPNDRDELLRYFLSLKKIYPYFVNINYGDENGYFLMVPPQRPEIHKLFDPRVRPWYTGAMRRNGLYWTEVYIFASSQRPGITVSAPILNSQHRPFAVCSIDIDLSTLSRFLKKVKVGKHGYAFIMENNTRRIIAHPELPRLYEDPAEIDRLTKSISELRRSRKEFGTTFDKGRKFFTAYVDYPQNNWTIGVTLPEADFMGNLKKVKEASVTIILGAILLASFMSYLLMRTIARPLKELKKGFETISKGNLDHEVSVRDRGVIGSLATSFNRMSQSLKKSRKELERTYRILAEKEKMAALGQLTAGIAHEIKNPLAIMLSSAQVVVNQNKPEEMRQEAANYIIEEIKRLNKTLENFLAFARPARSDLVDCDLVEVLEKTIDSMEKQLQEAGIKVDWGVEGNLPLCRADCDQMRQVFINLLLNAVYAMPEGGRLTIRCSKKPAGEWLFSGNTRLQPGIDAPCFVRISISDTGIGIAPEDVDKIFEPFFSLRDGGTGLGLATVYQILKMHHAGIAVSTRPGKGSTFVLIFPCENFGDSE